MINRVTVCGLGKLGLPMAAVFASRGYTVIGYDSNKSHINNIISGNHGIQEPDLDELLNRFKTDLHFTSDPRKAFRKADIIFVIVPTPSHEDGYFMNDYLVHACKEIGRNLDQYRHYYLIVIVSTVMPGTMESVVKPTLEKTFGMECGKDFGLCYNPEFVALGSVINNMYNPDAYLIGESDPKAGAILEKFLISEFESIPAFHMDFYNAEVAKICLNAYLTTKISFANYIAGLCEKYPKGNVDLVTEFLGTDSRIGSKFLKGGTGFGGPCFTRDNVALTYFAKQIGAGYDLQEATVVTNINTNIRIADRISELVEKQSVITILGASFKPNTTVVDGSASLEIALMLADRGYVIRLHDPLALENAKKVLGDLVIYSDNITQALDGVETIVLATPWPVYKDILPLFRGRKLFDCWRFFNPVEVMKHGIEYYAVGVSNTIPL